MEYLLEHKKPFWWFTTGVHVEVRLGFTPEEIETIRQNDMFSLVIVPRPVTTVVYEDADGKKQKREEDNNLYFAHFWDNGCHTSWYFTSINNAKLFEKELKAGFEYFKTVLVANSTMAEPSYEDFGYKEPRPLTIGLIRENLWFEHTYVLGESGGGKTQLLQSIFLEHATKPNPPAFFIVDSQNQMLPLIKRKFPDALFIDPILSPPSLNLFDVDVRYEDKRAYNQLLETFFYLFESNGEPLTGRQRTIFNRAIALMIFGYRRAFHRAATIADFEDFFTGARKGRTRTLSPNALKAVQAMPMGQGKWYETEYEHFDEACNQVLQRLENICGENSLLRPMLTSKSGTVDFRAALDKGAIVLINSNKGFLGKAGAAFFGRFFIKLLEQQLHNRTEASAPMFFMADEAQEYFDSTIQTFLDQARKRRIACVFAHQRLSQLRNDPVLMSGLTGVAIRIATNVNDDDQLPATRLLRMTYDEVRNLHREPVVIKPTYADYGLYVRGEAMGQTYRLRFYQLEEYDPLQGHFHNVGEEQEAPFDEFQDCKFETERVSPIKARDGGIIEITIRPEQPPKPRYYKKVRLKPGTKNGMRLLFRNEGNIRPDEKRGHLIVKLDIPPIPETPDEKTQSTGKAIPEADQEDAKPW